LNPPADPRIRCDKWIGPADTREAHVGVSIVLLQAALWVCMGVLFQGSIQNDVAEGVVDGPEWQLSYLRHPPLSSWLSGLASTTGSMRYVVLFSIALAFACSAFAMGAAFVARVDGRGAGLVALLGGLASPYGTYWPLKFNHNIGVMPFWAMTIWAAWAAFESDMLAPWIGLGVIAGLGFWAKYAILQLLIPLTLLFVATPAWRRKALTPGPWVAALICLAIVTPHFIDVLRKGATTIKWAIHTAHADAPNRVGSMAQFLLDCVLANLPFALIAWAACGRVGLVTAIKSMFARGMRNRLDAYLHVASIGPILVILGAGPFGVHLFYHWVTPLTVGFAVWWGHAAHRAGLRVLPRRAFLVFAGCGALTVGGYVAVRELAPLYLRPGVAAYEEMDGPALAELAQHYWASHESGPIPYIVSFGGKVGFQAAGSIVFDLPYRVRVLKDGLAINLPRIDIDDIRRRGALVVAGNAPAHESLQGVEVAVRNVESFPRPVVARNVSSPPTIYFGVIEPGS
jgi:Dolichyl-phosphate-mannose-protein mannosyltransferase